MKITETKDGITLDFGMFRAFAKWHVGWKWTLYVPWQENGIPLTGPAEFGGRLLPEMVAPAVKAIIRPMLAKVIADM